MFGSRAGLILAAALAAASGPLPARPRGIARRVEDKRIKREANNEAVAKAQAKRERKLAKRAREAGVP